jgi:NADPH:quinone reductase-like Zn-dependent oxidoreductase
LIHEIPDIFNHKDKIMNERGNRMKAVIYSKYGDVDVLKLTELEKPIPKSNEVLIKIHATTVTPLDWKFRSGKVFLARLMSGPKKPKNPLLGTEISGVITEKGNDATLFEVDDAVFAMIQGGGYAQYICLDQNEILKNPINMTYEEAASVPFGAISAYHYLVKVGKIQKGYKVLINGASGGVGIFAVQLAKYFGAHVTGVCSGKNVEMVKSLGADEVIDYTTESFTSKDTKYEIVFDAVGKSSYKKCKKLLTDNGVYISTILSFRILIQMIFTSVGKGKRAIFSMPSTPIENLKIIKSIIEKDKLKTFIGKKYPLSEVADAHRYAQTGHAKGKVVMTIE